MITLLLCATLSYSCQTLSPNEILSEFNELKNLETDVCVDDFCYKALIIPAEVTVSNEILNNGFADADCVEIESRYNSLKQKTIVSLEVSSKLETQLASGFSFSQENIQLVIGSKELTPLFVQEISNNGFKNIKNFLIQFPNSEPIAERVLLQIENDVIGMQLIECSTFPELDLSSFEVNCQ